MVKRRPKGYWINQVKSDTGHKLPSDNHVAIVRTKAEAKKKISKLKKKHPKSAYRIKAIYGKIDPSHF